MTSKEGLVPEKIDVSMACPTLVEDRGEGFAVSGSGPRGCA